jgi:hypothetical protein|tara:strand:- start:32 stop:742 length:711 start_codon:yes stop_codon:yes gene_type:complete
MAITNPIIKIEINKYPVSTVKIVKIFTDNEISLMRDLYEELPLTINNIEQKTLKKQWIQNYKKELDIVYHNRIMEVLNDFQMDNLKDKHGDDIYGLFQESFKPLPLHADTGFNLDNKTYKQLLTPLSGFGETVIFKNRWYSESTTFTVDEEELEFIPGTNKNKRSNKHIIKGKKFDPIIHKKFLNHIDINNLEGLEIDTIYKWKIGETLIFDRTHLHSSSSNLNNKKLGLVTFTKK